MTMRWMAAVAALATLGACDDLAVLDDLTYAEMVESNADMAARVTPQPWATGAEMPVSGAAVFEGFATMTLATEEATDLVGTARVEADFGDETVEGELGNFAGHVEGGRVQRMDGTLVLSDGSLGSPVPSAFGANMGGVLTGSGDVVGVDGSVAGHFRSDGDGVSGLTATAASGTIFTLDGVPVPGVLGIVAER